MSLYQVSGGVLLVHLLAGQMFFLFWDGSKRSVGIVLAWKLVPSNEGFDVVLLFSVCSCAQLLSGLGPLD